MDQRRDAIAAAGFRSASAPAAQQSGLALLVTSGSGHDPAGHRPLTSAACLALVRIVLDAGGEAWRSTAEHPALAAWLAEAGLGGGCERHVASVVAALRRCLVPVPSPPGGGLSAEAVVLLDAVHRAAEHETLAARFSAAVDEARTEGLRELAYGAGHEINNPLANIAARAQALLGDEQDPERRRRLATIVDQAFRARDMIGGLMVVARPPKPQPERIGVHAIVRPVVESLAARVQPRGVVVSCRVPADPLEVEVDATQIAESVRAIVMNACEAVADAGCVTVEVARQGSAQPSHWCEIIVIDDGRGMDAESLRRAGDPFFSGREAGRGIGLGLPKARRLIEANGGRLALASAPGRGTRAVVALPLAGGDARRE